MKKKKKGLIVNYGLHTKVNKGGWEPGYETWQKTETLVQPLISIAHVLIPEEIFQEVPKGYTMVFIETGIVQDENVMMEMKRAKEVKDTLNACTLYVGDNQLKSAFKHIYNHWGLPDFPERSREWSQVWSIFKMMEPMEQMEAVNNFERYVESINSTYWHGLDKWLLQKHYSLSKIKQKEFQKDTKFFKDRK